jgi:hypothetical protein
MRPAWGAAKFTYYLWYIFPITPKHANIMKTLQCDLCEVTAEGETFEDWMQALQPHYKEAHPEVMNDTSKTAEDHEKWVVENKARFDAAE